MRAQNDESSKTPPSAARNRWLARRFARALGRETGGVAAVEFALVAPLLITTYFGICEISTYINADRKVTQVASTTADLISQYVQVSNAEINDVFKAADALIAPFSSTGMTIIVSSVRRENDQFKVTWSDGHNITARATNSTISVPDANLIPKDSGQTLIIAEVTYVHRSPISTVFMEGAPATDVFYLKPRRVLAIQRVN